MTAPDTHTLLQRNRELGILRHIAETLNRASDIQAALDDTLRSVVELLGLQTAWVFLIDENGALYLAAWQDVPPALAPGGDAWEGGCSCNNIFRSGALKHAINVVHCSRLAEAAGDRRGLEFHASVPLRSEDHMIGILNVASPGSDRFTADVLELLGSVGYQLGTAIERVRLARQAANLAALEERNRIAREIHDTVAQGLTAITLHLEAAEALGADSPEAVLRNIRQAQALARTNLEEVRRSVLDLRAAPLEQHTLPEALELLLEAFGDETEVATLFQSDAEIGRLPTPIESGLYRIFQEALSNIRKYANATTVQAHLTRSNKTLHLQIEDDGAGFDPAAIEAGPGHGFGLIGMNERARLLGGHLSISSAPGEGTQIEVEVPTTDHHAQRAPATNADQRSTRP